MHPLSGTLIHQARCIAMFVGGERLLWSARRRVGALPHMGQVVRVFVLGGTGVVGSAVVRELVMRGHEVFGLARTPASAAKLRQRRATPIAGDIGLPEQWAGTLPQFGAIIHAACDFDTDMGAVDRRLLDLLMPALAVQREIPRLVYTGGCWLFGATGDELATEETPLPFPPSPGWCRSCSASNACPSSDADTCANGDGKP